MLILKLQFPTGRYHGTAWGRHVNEGEAEWPPSPYRLVRALYDAWKRKRPDWAAERVESLLAALAAAPPRFALPPAEFAHTRSFLSVNTQDPSERTLIFDGFAVLGEARTVLMAWPGISLTPKQAQDLGDLLLVLNFLGRSESWVMASLATVNGHAEWNCVPATEAVIGHPLAVACVVPREEYKPPVAGAKKGARGWQNWLDALAFSTGDLIAERTSGPPAMRMVEYVRRAKPRVRAHAVPRGAAVEAVVYALQSKVLPPVTAALHVAERVRVNLMGAHKRVVGHPARVSERFSGKGADGTPLQGHQHAFVLPYDEDRDGKLDHVAVFCRQPFDVEEQLALDRMGAVWQPSGRPEVRCVPVRRGRTETILKRGRVFQSATPFVPARHYRRGRGELSEWLAGEIRRECTNQNLPTPLSIRMLERFGLRDGRSVRWLEFDRNRKDDPARLGFGFELEFPEPMTPFALGYGCHFGLGQFHPVRVSD